MQKVAIFIAISIFFGTQAVFPSIDHAWATSLQPEEPADDVLIYKRETTWERYLHSASELPDWMDLGLSQRIRLESFDHPFRPGEFGNDVQLPMRSRIRLGLNGTSTRFLFEGQDSRSQLVDTGELMSGHVVNTTDVLQLFGSITHDNIFGTGLRTDLHVGRLTMDFGKRRYIGRNDFANTTNSFNGVHWQLAQDGAWRIRAFFVLPTIQHQHRLDTFDTDFTLWGAYYETQQLPWLRTNLYYFGLNDQRSTVSKKPNTHRRLDTVGSRVYALPTPGKLDYEIEAALQTGSNGRKDHFAYNPHLELGYTFNLPWSPRLLAQYDYASGTRSPDGSESHTFDTLFGEKRFEFTPTGTFSPFTRSNISSPGWRLITQPARGWKVQLKHRAWYLAQARDTFVGSGLQDKTGQSGNFLGHDVELRAQWRLNANFQVELGYDRWFKGSFFDRLPTSAALPAGGEKDTNFFHVSTKVRF